MLPEVQVTKTVCHQACCYRCLLLDMPPEHWLTQLLSLEMFRSRHANRGVSYQANCCHQNSLPPNITSRTVCVQGYFLLSMYSKQLSLEYCHQAYQKSFILPSMPTKLFVTSQTVRIATRHALSPDKSDLFYHQQSDLFCHQHSVRALYHQPYNQTCLFPGM